MKHKHYITPYIVFATLIILVLGLTACGSGGGGGGNSNNNPGGGNPLIITGQAIKGPVSGGTVTAYAVASGAKGAVLKTVVTDAGGNYNLSIESYSGPVFLEITGGSYIDEATGNPVNLPPTVGSGLQAVIDNVSAGSTVQSQITPLTTMAVARAQNMSGGLTPSNINAANQEIGAYFGGINLLTTQPINPLVSNSSTGATQEAINYGLILGGLSQQAQLLGLTNPLDLVSALVEDSSDGSFDGQSGSGPISLNGTPMNITTGNVDLATAISTFSGDTIHNVSGGTVSSTLITSLQNSGSTPAAPTGLNATPGDGQVTVSWNAVSGATSYNVYMASQSGVTKSNYSTLSGGNMYDGITSPIFSTGLTNGIPYYFVVTAMNAIGESIESNEVSATPATSVTIPNAPNNLQANAVSSTQINLTWTDNSANENGFRIERKIGAAGTYNEIASVGSNITNYSDSTSLVANTVYCYQTRSFNGAGNSDYSNESCTTTPQSGTIPSAPTGVTATPGDGQVTVSWNPVSGATSYNVYMASQGGVTKSNYNTLSGGMLHSNATSPFVHTGLSNGTTYYFVVTAVNANGESVESIEVIAVPMAEVGSILGVFKPLGGLDIARTLHTATLLPDGKVLVAGGDSGSASLASVELYDPDSGTFTPTGSMSKGCSSHTATLLPNGKVLIAGGSSGSAFLASAELYDPATGTFAATGGMRATRSGHTATLLPNGKVLITGGYSGSASLASAELYDPDSGTFTATGSMSKGRSSHTATLLPNGKVLVAGYTSAELYDPATGTFDSTGSMGAVGTGGHTATLLSDGKVLITGFTSAQVYDPATGTFAVTGSMSAGRSGHAATLLPDGKVLVTGGRSGSTSLASAELYDPATGEFTVIGGTRARRFYHKATLLPDGKVLVTGGGDTSSISGTTIILASAELYDPATGKFAWTRGMSAARYSHTATLLPNGKVLIAGGRLSSSTVLASAELYDPATGTFSATGSMNTKRYSHTATLLPDGKVLITGGYTGGTFVTILPSAELYDPATGTFALTGRMNRARIGHTATLLPNGKVLVAGGLGMDGIFITIFELAELYDPVTGTFGAPFRIGEARADHTATLLANGDVLIAGGSNASTSLKSADLYSFSDTDTGDMSVARSGHTATLLLNGKVLITGGRSAGSGSLASAELYDPATRTFAAIGSMSRERYSHTATLLSNGKVLITGGIGGITADLYDPSTGTFANPGLMSATRGLYHTATLLFDGMVLITGGYSSTGSGLDSAELFR